MKSADGQILQSLLSTEGISVVDLKDNVETLTEFTFRLPSVIEPKLYEVYLLINHQEVHVGSISLYIAAWAGY